MATYLITGGSRGIGLETVRQLAGRGETVITTVRREADGEPLRALGARVELLDVNDDRSIDAFAAAMRGQPIDVLINNAGVQTTIMRIEELTREEFDRVLSTNTVGPALVIRAMMDNLRAGTGRTIVNLSSNLGSAGRIPEEGRGEFYAYRAAKSGLNIISAALASDLRAEGFTVVALHPGWVRTDMGGADADLSVDESASGVIKVIDGLTPDKSGAFFDWAGRPMPW